MEVNNFSYFNSDNKCYQPKSQLNIESRLNGFIREKFDKYSYELREDSSVDNYLEECKNKAIEKQKSLFLVTDVKKDSQGIINYNCLIPKTSGLCSSGKLEDLLKPFNDLINNLFGDVNFRNKNAITNKLKIGEITDNNTCFYMEKNGERSNFSKSGNFVIYKTELIDDDIINNLSRAKSFKYYNDQLVIWEQQTDGILNNFKSKFETYICNPSNINEQNLDTEIVKIKDHYTTIFSLLDELALDIKNVSLITNYDTLYLEKLQKMIDEKKEQLKNLLGFDGANNGKLSDTLYLKNLKLSENIILVLVVTFIIFLYAKKQI
tara:strand:+ start:1320 stop:2282 length:963 start_codon:yes stop_codon:yes gene_type:complete